MWVIMNQPVSIHNSEYKVLREVIDIQTRHRFSYNKGTNYLAKPPARGRNIMYNNGEMVVGNQDQDKFIIKCTKREDHDKKRSRRPYDTHRDEVQAMQDREHTNTKTSLYTTFQPPVSAMSAIVFCIVISIMLFTIFASSNWIHQTAGEMADKKEKVQYGIFILITIALFVLYGLSFVLAASVVGAQPFGILLWTGLLLLWTSYPMKYLMRISSNYYMKGTIMWKTLSWLLYIFTLSIWIHIIGLGFGTAFAPSLYLNGSVSSLYTYYFTTGYSNNETIYIGKKSVMVMNFAGYRLNYYNQNTPVFDDNYIALPDDFMNLYGKLVIKEANEDENANVFSTKRIGVLDIQKELVMVEYDKLMKQDNSRPLDNLIQAIQNKLVTKSDNEENNEDGEDDEDGDKADKDSSSNNDGNKRSVEIMQQTVNYTLNNIDSFKVNFKKTLKNKSPDLYNFLKQSTTARV